MNVRLQQASSGLRHADVASKQPVAQQNGDRRRGRWAYARLPGAGARMPDAAPRRAAPARPDGPRRRRAFGRCRIICIACRRSVTTASRAAAGQTVLARSAIAPYTRRSFDPPRMKFLSRAQFLRNSYRLGLVRPFRTVRRLAAARRRRVRRGLPTGARCCQALEPRSQSRPR